MVLKKLGPFLYQLGFVLFLFFYFFSLLGMHLYGGLLNEKKSLGEINPLYVYNNFNDMFSGIVTLFELTIVNNWQVNVDVYIKITGTNYVKVYFITWYFLSVTLGLNLLISFMLECYLTTISQNESTEEENMEVFI